MLRKVVAWKPGYTYRFNRSLWTEELWITGAPRIIVLFQKNTPSQHPEIWKGETSVCFFTLMFPSMTQRADKKTCIWCRVIWPWSKCWLYPFFFDKSQMWEGVGVVLKTSAKGAVVQNKVNTTWMSNCDKTYWFNTFTGQTNVVKQSNKRKELMNWFLI